jgi:hypothetical protein
MRYIITLFLIFFFHSGICVDFLGTHMISLVLFFRKPGVTWATLDPWAHCHSLGGAKMTSKPPHLLGNWLTCHATTIQEPSSTVGWQGSGMDDRSMALDVARWPSHLKPPHLRLQLPPCSLHIIKGVVVLGGDHRLAALKHSKSSKLSEALSE